MVVMGFASFMSSHDALRIGYEATDWSQPISYEDYCELLQGWDVSLLKRGDEVIGTLFRKDGEVHVSILPEWRKRWVTRGLLRQILAGDNVTTRVTPGHEYYMHGILKRLGFVQKGEKWALHRY